MRLAAGLVRAALASAVSGLPACRAEWGRGMLAEVDAIADPSVRARWALGALATALRCRRPGPDAWAWLVLLPAGCAAVAFLDFSPSDDAGQVALLTLLVVGGALGFARPGWALGSGLALGSALAIAHLLYMLAGIEQPYPSHPSGLAGPLSLFVLVVPTSIAAWVGALVRRTAFGSRG